jgi:hypothetical protein
MRMLGFIKRNFWDFNNIHYLKTISLSLVRSNLQYGFILWNPSQLDYADRLNNFQSCFLRYMSYKFKINCSTKLFYD